MLSMKPMAAMGLIATLVMGISIVSSFGMALQPNEETARLQAKLLRQQGNWKDALELSRRLAFDATSDPARVHEDVRDTVECFHHLALFEEFDVFLHSAVETHPGNWRVLMQAAASILHAPHHGIISSNHFHRAPQRNDSGTWVDVQEQDRHQALRWLQRAIPFVANESDQSASASFYSQLVHALSGERIGQQAWLLQSKSKLDQDPDYTEIESAYLNRVARYAPVDAEGKPIFFETVATWELAANDGQRLRWAIDRWSAVQKSAAGLFWAGFLNSQFGVETLANDSLFERFQASLAEDDSAKEPAAGEKSGVYALHTLDDRETIARLANGIQRFTLPDEFNPIHIYQQLIREVPEQSGAYSRLVDVYTNRRQYSKAASICRQAIEQEFNESHFQQLLDSMVLPRGRFDIVHSQPAGKAASLGFVFRNAHKVALTASQVDVEKLLIDIKQFYRTHRPNQPPKFGGQRGFPPNIVEPSNIFSTVKIDNYLRGNTAHWTLDLKPRDNHWDRRIQVATPLQQAGLYVVTAKLEAPEHIARCLVWIQDTSIVRKQLDNKLLYYVADAVTGLPIPNADIEFFGFAQEYNNGRPQSVKIANFAKKTSADGQVVLNASELPSNFQWQVTREHPTVVSQRWGWNIFGITPFKIKAFSS